MRSGVVLITNNPSLCGAVFAGRLVDGSSLDVLIAARDAVHLGASLLTHPLCGNLRPHQQPFRSILIEENPGALVDLESLS
ncbi:MAG: GrdX family protein, partial [Synergistaceae bacterium]|nr:GrdX family protein [Synergistaceae bacterium]